MYLKRTAVTLIVIRYRCDGITGNCPADCRTCRIPDFVKNLVGADRILRYPRVTKV